jgi:hypothetical protein
MTFCKSIFGCLFELFTFKFDFKKAYFVIMRERERDFLYHKNNNKKIFLMKYLVGCEIFCKRENVK